VKREKRFFLIFVFFVTIDRKPTKKVRIYIQQASPVEKHNAKRRIAGFNALQSPFFGSSRKKRLSTKKRSLLNVKHIFPFPFPPVFVLVPLVSPV